MATEPTSHDLEHGCLSKPLDGVDQGDRQHGSADDDDEVHAIIEQAHNLARDTLIKNKSKLLLIAKRLIAEETIEGKALEALFSEKPLKAARKTTKTLTPAPIEPVAEAQPAPVPRPKKVSPVPRLVPKETPAASD